MNIIDNAIAQWSKAIENIKFFILGIKNFDFKYYIYLFIIVIIVIIFIRILVFIFKIARKISKKRKLYHFMNQSMELSPEEFFKLRSRQKGQTYHLDKYNVPGVYILKNESKNMYYVGQGKKVLDRVYHHFSGRGNGDVYADYKYGDHFLIQVVMLSSTNYKSLNDLERVYIDMLDAYNKGYNKTRGNK